MSASAAVRLGAPLLLGALVATSGCGGKASIAGSSPKATAEAFVEQMKAGNYDVVAAGFEYETYARANNENWDSIPAGQRDLIISKLQERKAAELQALSGMMTGEVTVGEARAEDDAQVVPITVGASTLDLHMVSVEGNWHIRQMVERARG